MVRNVSLLIASISCSLILMEILLRLFYPTNLPVFTYSEFGWSHVPNFKTRYRSPHGEFDVVNEYNSSGLRSDVDYSYEKPSGVYRILTLGDSFTDSREVSLEDTWSRILEKGLNALQMTKRVEVLNAGVAGYGANQAYAYLVNEGIKFQPDLVIYLHTGAPHRDVNALAYVNDKKEIELRENYTSARRILYLRMRSFLKRHSHLITHLTHNLRLTKRIRGFLRKDFAFQNNKVVGLRDITVPAKANRANISIDEYFDRWRLTVAIIDAMNRFVEANQGQFLLVYISCWRSMPVYYELLVDKNIPKMELCLLDHYEKKLHRKLSMNEKVPAFFPKDGHFNPEGGEVVAELIFLEVKEVAR